MGDAADLILGLYGAYRRQDLDELVGGMHPDAQFRPVPSARSYHGREDIRHLFEHDIHTLAEFDFRVVDVREDGDNVLLHGKNRVREVGNVRDAPIYWVGCFRDRLLYRFDAFSGIEEAMASYESETAGA